MRLDEDKLDTLRRWGQGLREASSEESAAAGRAILMLIDEIEQLQIELWHLRRQPSRISAGSSDEAAEDREEPVASTLHQRLQREIERDRDTLAGTEPDAAREAESAGQSDRTTTSPQSWIDALRRQR